MLIMSMLLCGCGAQKPQEAEFPENDVPAETPSPTVAPTPTPEPTPEPTPTPKPATEDFVLNSEHVLPILSIKVADYNQFILMSGSCNKDFEIPAEIALFEDGYEIFKSPCGIHLAGRTSIWADPKKSYNVYFRGEYGAKKLKCDVFGNGIDKYDSLNIRGGSDADRAMFTQDVWQTVAREMSDKIITQNSKFCILYVNEKYYGIYVLKENVGKSFYARINGVSKDMVEDCKPPNDEGSFYTDVYEFCLNNDMSVDANYEHIKSLLDIENFIDWMIVEGVSANNDVKYNARMFRSPELDSRWQFVLFDLDYANADIPWDISLNHKRDGSKPNKYTATVFTSLFENDEFRNQFLTRYGEVWDTALSNEKLMTTVEHYKKLIEPEVEQDRARWFGQGLWAYNSFVEKMEKHFGEQDWQKMCVDRFCELMNVTDEEKELYFGIEKTDLP